MLDGDETQVFRLDIDMYLRAKSHIRIINLFNCLKYVDCKAQKNLQIDLKFY